MTAGIDRSRIAIVDIDDAMAMEEALSLWGGASDPHAAWYRRGWRHERTGERAEPEGMAESAAYHSGMIAARDGHS